MHLCRKYVCVFQFVRFLQFPPYNFSKFISRDEYEQNASRLAERLLTLKPQYVCIIFLLLPVFDLVLVSKYLCCGNYWLFLYSIKFLFYGYKGKQNKSVCTVKIITDFKILTLH